MKKTMRKAGVLCTVMLIIFSSCSKLPGSFDDVKVDVNPSPLEVYNGLIETTISATFPEKYVPKKAIIEITPVLIYKNGELAGKTFKVQGEKVEANNKVITETGGNISEKVSFVYKEDMKLSQLVLRSKIIIKGNEYKLADLKIADGVITTSQLVDINGGMVALGKDEFQRVVNKSKEADIKYDIQQSNVRASETKKDDVQAFNEFMKDASDAEEVEINSLEISAYASPDGPTDLNTRLSGNRENSSESYLKSEMKRSKVKIDDEKIIAQSTPEDWEGFKEKMEQSNIQDKDLILRVLSMYEDPAVREKEIKNLSSAFEEVKETILPELRRSKMSLHVSIVGKSDEEITDIAAERPYRLNVEELLYAATLTQDVNKKLEIYKNATTFYPEDWRGFNNMGYLYYSIKDIKDAEMSFSKANSLKNDQPQVINNMGVMALVSDNFQVAEQYFGRAAGAGDVLDYNLGIINLKKCDYKVADKKLEVKNTNNAALSKIMLKDYTSALQMLNKVETPDGLTYYLKAIAGARTNNKALVLESLGKAIDLDKIYGRMASTDIEFMAYFMEPEFQAVVIK